VKIFLQYILRIGFSIGVTLTSAHAQQAYSDLSSQPIGRIYFNSITPKSKWELVHRKYDHRPTLIWGTLHMPQNAQGKIPAMIISPGSAGVGPKDDRWVNAFNKMGIAAFVVDSFGGRGIANTMDDQTQLSPASNDADALFALKLLGADPRIDSKKIGQIGFSRGGGVALDMVMDSFRKGAIDDDLRFAALIGFYPGCPEVWWEVPPPQLTGTPLMLALGEKDDYTPAKLCLNFVDRMRQDGQAVETHVYPDSYHGFDNPRRYFKRFPNATTAQKCPQVMMDVQHVEYYRLLSGEKYPSIKEVEAEIKTCVIRGVSAGANIQQGNQSELDVREFLKRAMGL
jgi:dienelactone hydrolase